MANDADNFREMLSAYVDGELSESDARRLEEAMQKDPSLAAELAKLRKVVFMLRHLGRQQAGEEFASRVMARVERANLVGGTAHGRRHAVRPSLMIKWGAVAAAVIICILAGEMYRAATHPGAVGGAAHDNQVALKDQKEEWRTAPPAPAPALPVAPAEGPEVSEKSLTGSGEAAPVQDRRAGALESGGQDKAAHADKLELDKLDKGAASAGLEKHKADTGADEKLALADQEKGGDEVLYTTNMDEARKNVEQVLACNGLGADNSTVNVAQSQLYNGARNIAPLLPQAGTQTAQNQFNNAPRNIGKAGDNNNNNNTGQAGANTLANNAFAYGNFKAVQNNDKQVQYQVLASPAQMPQIRSQLSQLRGTSNFNANAANGNSLADNSQTNVGGGGQGRGGLKVANDERSKDLARNLSGSQPCQAKNGPQAAYENTDNARVAGGPAGNKQASQQPLPTSGGANDRLSPAQKAPPPAEQAAIAASTAPASQPAAQEEKQLLNQMPQGQAQGKRESAQDGQAPAQSADAAKKLGEGQFQGGQGKASQSLQPLIITINVVAPASQANAAEQTDRPASSPATGPTQSH